MIDISHIKTLNFSIDTLVILSFCAILCIYVIFSAILYYHWKSYSTDGKVSGLTLGIYFFTTVPLLIIMAIITYII